MPNLGTKIPTYVPAGLIPIPPETVTLVNIAETAFSAERTHGCYRIEGCRPGQAYTTLVISARRNVIDVGDRMPGKIQNTRQEIASALSIGEDLVRGWNTDLWGIGTSATGEIENETVRGFAGVFVADGELPTDEELTMVREILALSDQALADCAHRDWDQFHRPDMIHAGWKRAMRRLGVDAEFLYTLSNQKALPDCAFCGSKMKTMTATVCATCGRDQNPVTDGHNASQSKNHPTAKRGRRSNAEVAA